jgi:4,5-dihydroxyphthalate decarboxylase
MNSEQQNTEQDVSRRSFIQLAGVGFGLAAASGCTGKSSENNLKLKIGCWQYDRTHALFNGTVRFDGIDTQFESANLISDIFQKMVREQAFDVSELGLTFYLRTLAQDNPPFIAIPVFPNRIFRHSAIFINKTSGIKTPQDLIGKTIGEFGVYGHDAGVWPKGILADDYGVTPDKCRWVIGATDWYMSPFDFIPHPHPDNVEVSPVPKGKTLGDMLESGKIDALISALVPKCVMHGSSNVERLFPDYERVERDYYKRTGIFPIMHTVVIRREILSQNPGLAKVIYKGFCDAKDIAMEHYRKNMFEQSMDMMVPWFSQLFDENSKIFPDDWWPYGIAANRKTIDTFLRYFFEQGLSERHLTCEDIFVPELLNT